MTGDWQTKVARRHRNDAQGTWMVREPVAGEAGAPIWKRGKDRIRLVRAMDAEKPD